MGMEEITSLMEKIPNREIYGEDCHGRFSTFVVGEGLVWGIRVYASIF